MSDQRQELIDAKWQLVVEGLTRQYYRSLDTSDLELWLDTFGPAGRLRLSDGRSFSGHEELMAYWHTRPASVTRRKHIVTDASVSEVSADTIVADIDMLVLDLNTGRVLAIGTTHDQLHRMSDGSWRYASKTITMAFRSDEL
jgi:hypothetical protein